MEEQYRTFIEKLKGDLESFTVLAEAGAAGHGSKTKALEARKASNQIAKDLKDFRKLSLDNDRAK